MNSLIACALSIIIAQPLGTAIAEDVATPLDVVAPFPNLGVTFKGGAFYRTTDRWLVGGIYGVPKTFGTLGIALETRRLKRALLGVGVDRTLSRWETTPSFDGRTRQRITAWSLYGEFGLPLWNRIDSPFGGWVTLDVGNVWASEEKTLDGIALDSKGSGPMLRFKFVGTQEVSRYFSVGFEAGWQIANPTVKYKWFDELAGDSLGAHRELILSGPLLEARVTISGP